MRHGSVFSGLGGFDLAAEWMGWETVFQCERDAFCRRVLQYYWPNARLYEEVKRFGAAEFRGLVDIISGGFPCQPFSVFGKRRGKKDVRYLWPEMLRIICEVRPRWVVGENVLGLLGWKHGLVFEEVQVGLEGAGYEVWPYILPAAGVGAPHRRERVFFVAHANCDGDGQDEEGRRGKGGDVRGDAGGDGQGGDAADAGSEDVEAALRRRWSNRLEEGVAACPTAEFRGRSADDWGEFPTESPFCAGDDGVSGGLDGITFSKWRKESLRAAGNAVVPQVVWRIFRTIERMEEVWRERDH